MLIPNPLPDHPRLLAEPADWPRLRRQIVEDAPSRQMFETLQRRAEAIVGEPPVARQMTGRLLLMISRQALERIAVLSLVACVLDDDRFARRAAEEMRAVAAFDDWNPGHFLDVAEMALAVSIGYDWLFERLDAETRGAVEAALLEKAIRPSLNEAAPTNWWIGADENWAQVCHGGLAAAAIVTADRDPATAERILRRALDRLPAVAANYAPDGAYPEGPMYWSYGTAYQVTLAAALQRLTGSSQGVDDYPGFKESADYIRHVTAPSGAYFNYSDCADRRRLQAQLFWLAHKCRRPDWLEHDLASLAGDLAEYEAAPQVQYWYYDMAALALLWHHPAPLAAVRPPQPVWHGRGPVPVALYRWGERNFYLGVKGGSVGISHSHMDVGSFVFEADGVRWAVDTGMQDYESLESARVDLWNEREQSSQRWDVFRIGAESHNILRLDGKPQLLFRKAEIIGATASACTVDLSGVYDDTSEVRRTFAIDPDGFTLIDTWRSEAEGGAVSQWLTFADVQHDEPGVVALTQGDRRLLLSVTSSDAVTIVVEDCAQGMRRFDAPNPGLRRIRMISPNKEGWLRVVVRSIARTDATPDQRMLVVRQIVEEGNSDPKFSVPTS